MTRRGITWEYNIALLKAYIELKGKAPKYNEIINGVKLGQFWTKAKSLHRTKNLTADRAAEVEYILNTML